MVGPGPGTACRTYEGGRVASLDDSPGTVEGPTARKVTGFRQLQYLGCRIFVPQYLVSDLRQSAKSANQSACALQKSPKTTETAHCLQIERIERKERIIYVHPSNARPSKIAKMGRNQLYLVNRAHKRVMTNAYFCGGTSTHGQGGDRGILSGPSVLSGTRTRSRGLEATEPDRVRWFTKGGITMRQVIAYADRSYTGRYILEASWLAYRHVNKYARL